MLDVPAVAVVAKPFREMDLWFMPPDCEGVGMNESYRRVGQTLTASCE